MLQYVENLHPRVDFEYLGLLLRPTSVMMPITRK